jgi:site-specific DNA-methyltransferase (adenine-specific)
MTIVPTNSKEKTGYPTQKPVKLLERIIKIHSNPGDWVLDFFAGSGTTGEAAARLGRKFVLVDNNPEAVEIMAKRLAFTDPEIIGLEVSIHMAQPMLM